MTSDASVDKLVFVDGTWVHRLDGRAPIGRHRVCDRATSRHGGRDGIDVDEVPAGVVGQHGVRVHDGTPTDLPSDAEDA